MIGATVDIGSNTSLLLVVRLSEEKKEEPKVLEDQIFFTRLAEGLSTSTRFQRSALKRQREFFERAQKIVKKYSVEKIKCVATAPARRAENSEELVLMGEQYGFPVKIISPEDEAQISRKGALFALSVNSDSAIVLDIGGGSTEISTTKEFFSMPIGSVNLTEEFIRHDPATKEEQEALTRKIKQELDKIPFPFSKNSCLVATAGTPTTLAALENKINKLDELHGLELSREQVDQWWSELFSLTYEERRKLKGMPIYRADVMPAGLSILKVLMQFFQIHKCTVSITGLRYGLLSHL